MPRNTPQDAQFPRDTAPLLATPQTTDKGATKRPIGQSAVGTYKGDRIHVRYGTSRLGPDWEIVQGDLFGHIPDERLTDVVYLEAEPARG